MLTNRLKTRIIWNNPLPAIRRKNLGKDGKVTILHQRKHWTQYLERILETDTRFMFRRARDAEAGYDDVPDLDVNDSATISLVIGGFGCLENTFLTRWHRVLLRVQHSPGWGTATFIWAYPWAKKHGFKLMIPKCCWEMILKTNSFHHDILKKRDQILRDNTPLAFIHFDPKLNRILNSAKTVEKKSNSVVIACNWRIAANKDDTKRLVQAIQRLKKSLKITVNLHPNTLNPPLPTQQSPVIFLAALKEAGITEIVTQDSTDDMVRLYDAHEFILTDGSGTAYEAITRGCKALTLDGLSYQTNKKLFHSTFELGLMPKTLVWNYKNHPGNQIEMEWLKGLYPASLVKEDVTPYVAQEIVDVFKRWQ